MRKGYTYFLCTPHSGSCAQHTWWGRGSWTYEGEKKREAQAQILKKEKNWDEKRDEKAWINQGCATTINQRAVFVPSPAT